MSCKDKYPHCLMELSLEEVRILKRNIINLGGLSFDYDLKKGPMIAS